MVLEREKVATLTGKIHEMSNPGESMDRKNVAKGEIMNSSIPTERSATTADFSLVSKENSDSPLLHISTDSPKIIENISTENVVSQNQILSKDESSASEQRILQTTQSADTSSQKSPENSRCQVDVTVKSVLQLPEENPFEATTTPVVNVEGNQDISPPIDILETENSSSEAPNLPSDDVKPSSSSLKQDVLIETASSSKAAEKDSDILSSTNDNVPLGLLYGQSICYNCQYYKDINL